MCGKCCRLVYRSRQTQFLDRGDGVCRYLDENTNLCTIYEIRPIECRVQDYYKKYLSKYISWLEFIEINKNICKDLRADID